MKRIKMDINKLILNLIFEPYYYKTIIDSIKPQPKNCLRKSADDRVKCYYGEDGIVSIDEKYSNGSDKYHVQYEYYPNGMIQAKHYICNRYETHDRYNFSNGVLSEHDHYRYSKTDDPEHTLTTYNYDKDNNKLLWKLIWDKYNDALIEQVIYEYDDSGKLIKRGDYIIEYGDDGIISRIYLDLYPSVNKDNITYTISHTEDCSFIECKTELQTKFLIRFEDSTLSRIDQLDFMGYSYKFVYDQLNRIDRIFNLSGNKITEYTYDDETNHIISEQECNFLYTDEKDHNCVVYEYFHDYQEPKPNYVSWDDII